jgi:hypothetical protein
MDELIAKNQNTFIRNWNIQDNFKYIQRAVVLIRKKKVPMLLLKLDISKAFDTLSCRSSSTSCKLVASELLGVDGLLPY